MNLAQAVLLKNANTEVLFTDEEIQEATKTNEKILNDIKEQKAKAKAIQKVAAAGNFDQAAKMSGGDKTAGKNKSYRLKYYTLNQVLGHLIG